jgi:hypothetical protein
VPWELRADNFAEFLGDEMTGTNTKLPVSLGFAVMFLLANAGAAQADYVTNAVSGTTWESSLGTGGLGGGAAILNSAGGNPFSSGPWFDLSGLDVILAYSANLGPAGSFSNTADGVISSFGEPDTTSYGNWFVAPDNAILSEFDFVIANESPGTNATFVLATWSPVDDVPVTLLYEQSSFVNNDGNFDVNVNALPNIRLVAGQDYIALLTVASVPEPSTWAMMLIGFAGLGYAGYRQRQKPAGLASV